MDFSNTVIVMTSNLANQLIQELSEKLPYQELKNKTEEIAREYFRPEFVNRIDEILVFLPLTKSEIREICKIQTGLLDQRLKQQGLSLQISDAAIDFLSELGFDQVYGARPLKRTLQRELEKPLAESILEGKFESGSTIAVNLREGQIEISRA